MKKKVQCPVCNRLVEDEGRRNTCRFCGMEPVPSFAYPASSAFHPDHFPQRKRGTSINQLYTRLKERRAT